MMHLAPQAGFNPRKNKWKNHLLTSSLLVLLQHLQPTTTTGGLGVLTTNLQAPVMTETTMVAASLHALQVHTQATIQVVCGQMRGLSVLEVLASVQEPSRDLKLKRVSEDRDDLV